jgi:polyhydroxybutyrate depolymerase
MSPQAPGRLAAAALCTSAAALAVATLPANAVPPQPIRAGIRDAAQVASPCASAANRASHWITLEVGGRDRSILVHLPPSRAGVQLPLLLAFHGFGGSGPGMERETGLSALADARGFIVAFPEARDGRWSVRSGLRERADLDFVHATLDYLESRYCIDRARVYAVGGSNGGSEAVHIACELADRVAAAAFVAGDYRAAEACQPVAPVSVLEIHGVEDPVVPYRGYEPEGGPGAVFGFLSLWTALDRCSTPPVHQRIARHMLQLTWHCETGTSVSHIKIYDFGHGWPGGHPAPGRLPGPTSASTLLWTFFTSLPQRRDERRLTAA